MKFTAFALVLLVSLFASLSHGMAAAPGCVQVLADDLALLSGTDAVARDGAGEGSSSPDDAHCGFAMMATDRASLAGPGASSSRTSRQLVDLLLGRDRMPDERPPDASKV